MTIDTPKAYRRATAAPEGSPFVLRCRSILVSLGPFVVAAVISILIVASVFAVWKFDWRVPLDTDPDAHLQQMIVKNFVESGHFYVNPRLGAPGEQEMYDFPVPHWTHVAVWSLLRLFSHNYGVVLNLYYFLTFPLCALTALYALRRFGISTGLAIAGAVLFTILPFHLFRRESHLFLSALYTVPLSAMVIVWIAIGHPLFGYELSQEMPSRAAVTKDGIIALASCVLIGWDHPYYAFFAAGLLLIAGLLGTFRHGHRKALLSAVILSTTVAAALSIALLPNILYFRTHGRVLVAHRLPEESEIAPLTVVQLIAPIPWHRVSFLAHLTQFYNAHSPTISENFTSGLGFLGSLGFFASLASFFRKRCSEFLYSLGVLNLWALLVGVMGGFGTLFAFLVSPQIRAYNRISVFIGFFSIAGLVWAIDRWLHSRRARIGLAGMVLVPSLLLAVGIFDQIPYGYGAPRSVAEAEFNEQDAFISRVEHSVPPGSEIFQLPYMCFPECGGINKAAQDEHLLPYLHSSSLRWSYGAMRYRPTARWLETVSAEPPDRMIKSIADAGFSGILLDRFGYADNGASLETELRRLLKSEPIMDSRGRYLFFRLDN